MNSTFTFDKRNKKLRRYVVFMIVIQAGTLLSTILLFCFVFFLEPIVAKLITIPIVAIFQFMLNKLWTFR